MTKASVGDWSLTAASNTTVDGTNIDENCEASGINNAIRSVMSGVTGALTAVVTSGTDTYTATLSPAPDALATGVIYLVKFATTNSSTTPTINFNTLGAKTIVRQDGTALVAGDLNGEHALIYDGTNMRVLNPVTPNNYSSYLLKNSATTTTVGYKFTSYSAGTVSIGTLTPDAANGNYQYYTNNGAHTLAAPADDSAIDILVTNGASAGAITFSGFTVSSSVGDALDTTSTHKFIISIRRINSVSTYIVKALQ